MVDVKIVSVCGRELGEVFVLKHQKYLDSIFDNVPKFV